MKIQLSSAHMYEKAQEIAKKVVELDDEEPAYYYNYATILRDLGQFPAALNKAKRAVELATKDDADHLALLCELLKESNDPVNLELLGSYMHQLEKVSPLKARLIRMQ